MDLFINRIHQVLFLYQNFGEEKTLITFSSVRSNGGSFTDSKRIRVKSKVIIIVMNSKYQPSRA